MFILLSFTLSSSTPTPGGRPALSILIDESVERGNPGNTFYYTAWNHAGTHVDAPGHMLRGQKVITDLSISHLIFEHAHLVDVPKKDDQLITADDLRPHANAIAQSDLLLLRTGFTEYRGADPSRYRDHNPGLSIEVARYLSSHHFPRLRAIGIDSISMAAAAHAFEGLEAHKILFAKNDQRPTVLIEDMDFSADLTHLRRVIVAPLFIEGLDSSPCTVIAEVAADPEDTSCH
jgi:arylformamidase